MCLHCPIHWLRNGKCPNCKLDICTCGYKHKDCKHCPQPPKSETGWESEVAELVERIVIEYANLSGRESNNRAVFRQRITQLIRTQIAQAKQEAVEEFRKKVVQNLILEKDVFHLKTDLCTPKNPCTPCLINEMRNQTLAEARRVVEESKL